MTGNTTDDDQRKLLVTRAARVLVDATRHANDAAEILLEALALLDDEQPKHPELWALPGAGENVAGRDRRLTGTARHMHAVP